MDTVLSPAAGGGEIHISIWIKVLANINLEPSSTAYVLLSSYMDPENPQVHQALSVDWVNINNSGNYS